ILVVVHTLLVVCGHNLIQAFERYLALILGILFGIATVIALTHGSTIAAWQPKPVGSTLALFAIVLAVSFSYIMSWSPYASDYSRYLADTTPRSYVAVRVLFG